ncbi:hypothetical protein QIA41_06245 (plasmid) [Borreliella sinica]|uniref:hypothetical protein n=1 Tax=Borreliella sinica TaxID=87162 RepID=UPI003AEF6212
MNKKILIIYAVFALIISCKNYASGEDLKQNLKAYVDKELMQGDDPKNSLFNPPPVFPPNHHDNTPILKVPQAQSGGQQDKKEDKEKEEIEKKIKELKEKIDKSDDKTSLNAYSSYEEEIKKIKEELEEKLKDKKEDKEKLEKELETLEKTLKEKIAKRKKALEDAKKKFEEFKQQVESASGVTHGEQARGKGSVGQQAWSEANTLGLRVSYSNDDDTSGMSNGIIDGAIKQIEEELKSIGVRV